LIFLQLIGSIGVRKLCLLDASRWILSFRHLDSWLVDKRLNFSSVDWIRRYLEGRITRDGFALGSFDASR